MFRMTGAPSGVRRKKSDSKGGWMLTKCYRRDSISGVWIKVYV